MEEDCDNLLAWLAKLEVGITKTKVVMSVQHAEGLGNRLVTTSWNCSPASGGCLLFLKQSRNVYKILAKENLSENYGLQISHSTIPQKFNCKQLP